ncbi:hypothetical protein D3C80_1716820 [compost metagenome]
MQAVVLQRVFTDTAGMVGPIDAFAQRAALGITEHCIRGHLFTPDYPARLAKFLGLGGQLITHTLWQTP